MIGSAALAGQYEPAGHTTCARAVEQKLPASHGTHSGDVMPVEFDHVPSAQRPLHSAVASPDALPNRPTGQAFAAASVEPSRQKKPASHGPEHADVVAPARPQRPASQSPVHEAAERPALEPYRPAGHWLAWALWEPAKQ